MSEHWNGGSGGKGDKPRPFSVSQEEFDNRWDTIFGKKEKKKEEPKKEEFDLESLDPDERSWYYDDHGIKRRKQN